MNLINLQNFAVDYPPSPSSNRVPCFVTILKQKKPLKLVIISLTIQVGFLHNLKRPSSSFCCNVLKEPRCEREYFSKLTNYSFK